MFGRRGAFGGWVLDAGLHSLVPREEGNERCETRPSSRANPVQFAKYGIRNDSPDGG